MILQINLFGPGGLDPTTIGVSEVSQLLLRFIMIALALIGGIIFIYILVAGIQYITAGGNEAKQAEAKKAIQAALIGFLIVLGAFTITRTLLQRFQFDATIIKNSQDLDSGVKDSIGQ
jgi:hypothetical protein